MITISAARAWIAAQLGELDGVTVLPRGVDGAFDPPVIVVGQPDIEFDTEHLCATDRVFFPIAVVVRHAPDGPASTQTELEDLWPQAANALRGALAADPTMGGVASAAWLSDSSFGEFAVQGAAYPSQQITVEIHG